MFHDVRYAVRRLRNAPAFSAVAVATIALAVGANTAMFSFVNGMFLRPLPYPQPDRIVRLLERVPTGGLNGASTLNYLDWTRQSTVFEYLAAEVAWRPTLATAGEPALIRGARVSAHYFDVFGIQPVLGRPFRDTDEEPGSDRIVLLSHQLWERRFGSSPSMIGQSIVLDGEAHTVVGVLPSGPFDRATAQIWKPLAFQPANMTRDFRWLGVSGKLKEGVTLDRARDEMAVIGQRLGRTYPDADKGWSVAVDRLSDVLIGPQLHTAIAILFAATLFVLLIGCANLANLARARSLSREGELAVRAALGAGRRRLIQGPLIEHFVTALVGGLAGAGVGYALLKWIQSFIPPSTLPPAVDVRIDGPVLLFTLAATVGTGVLFGIAPAAHAGRARVADALRKTEHGTATIVQGRRMRSALIVAEVALAFILLVASGVLMRSFFKLLEIDRGFDSTNVLTASLPVAPAQHPDPVELNAYLASIRLAVEAVPGVRHAALTSALPLQGWGFGVPYAIAGREAADSANRRPGFFKIVSPSYFEALGIRLRAGRLLNENDRMNAPRAALINDTLAKREFPNADPIGRRLLVPEIAPGTMGFGKPVEWEIVGVVAGEKINGLADEQSAGLYVSNAQSPTYGVSLIVQAEVPPLSLQQAIRSAIDTVNRNQPLGDIRTLEDLVSDSVRGNRVVSRLLGVFSAMALLLAAVGLYGVMSHAAVARTRELGVRAALGASGGRLRNLIMFEGMRLALGGLALGVLGTFPATDALSSVLYGVASYDALTMAGAAAVLTGVAGVACFIPAWRITRTDPMTALRHE